MLGSLALAQRFRVILDPALRSAGLKSAWCSRAWLDKGFGSWRGTETNSWGYFHHLSGSTNRSIWAITKWRKPSHRSVFDPAEQGQIRGNLFADGWDGDRSQRTVIGGSAQGLWWLSPGDRSFPAIRRHGFETFPRVTTSRPQIESFLPSSRGEMP